VKSRITSNLDVSLTPAQRRQAETDEYNDARIQSAVDKAKREGSGPRIVGADGKVFATYDRLAEKEAFAAGDRPSLIPIAVRVGPQFPGGYHYILSDADMDAVMAGYYCGRCLDRLPASWTPSCPTCGIDRDMH
jgi:hypothetical protein